MQRFELFELALVMLQRRIITAKNALEMNVKSVTVKTSVRLMEAGRTGPNGRNVVSVVFKLMKGVAIALLLKMAGTSVPESDLKKFPAKEALVKKRSFQAWWISQPWRSDSPS